MQDMQDCGFEKADYKPNLAVSENMSDFDQYNTVYIFMHIQVKWPIQKLFFSWSSENRSKFNWPLELLYFAAENTKSVSFRSLEELRCLWEKILENLGTVLGTCFRFKPELTGYNETTAEFQAILVDKSSPVRIKHIEISMIWLNTKYGSLN